MEKKQGYKIKLGIFVIAGIAVFVAGIYFIGDKQLLFGKTFSLSCVFREVNGLQAGNNVRFSGLNVGVVEGIEQITDSTVRVDMRIDEGTHKFIKKDATASIGSDGLMGNKIIAIGHGVATSQVVKENDFIASMQPANIDDILASIKVTADNAAYMTEDLAVIFNNIRTGKGTVGKLFSDTTMATNLGKTMVNIKEGSQGLKQNMDAAKHSFLLRGFFKKKAKNKEREKERDKDR